MGQRMSVRITSHGEQEHGHPDPALGDIASCAMRLSQRSAVIDRHLVFVSDVDRDRCRLRWPIARLWLLNCHGCRNWWSRQPGPGSNQREPKGLPHLGDDGPAYRAGSGPGTERSSEPARSSDIGRDLRLVVLVHAKLLVCSDEVHDMHALSTARVVPVMERAWGIGGDPPSDVLRIGATESGEGFRSTIHT